jgi:hypothetical protein
VAELLLSVSDLHAFTAMLDDYRHVEAERAAGGYGKAQPERQEKEGQLDGSLDSNGHSAASAQCMVLTAGQEPQPMRLDKQWRCMHGCWQSLPSVSLIKVTRVAGRALRHGGGPVQLQASLFSKTGSCPL